VTLTPEDLERLLRAGRPSPRPDFVRALERNLVPRRSRRERVRLRVAIAGISFAVALGAMAIALNAVGLLPFQLGGGNRAQAEQDCRMVKVEQKERVPTFGRNSKGELVVRYHTRTVPRLVKRCR
jgi:hypothetical protein